MALSKEFQERLKAICEGFLKENNVKDQSKYDEIDDVISDIELVVTDDIDETH